MEEYLLRLALTQWSKDCFGPTETARKLIVLQNSEPYMAQELFLIIYLCI
jgi:hypothetical protein